jgi:hypothetical protein
LKQSLAIIGGVPLDDARDHIQKADPTQQGVVAAVFASVRARP